MKIRDSLQKWQVGSSHPELFYQQAVMAAINQRDFIVNVTLTDKLVPAYSCLQGNWARFEAFCKIAVRMQDSVVSLIPSSLTYICFMSVFGFWAE